MFKLRLNNYRGFLNEEFNFSRINILIGENSAGKSSIFKFLLALKQSLISPNNKDYNLTLSGEETDLGNYYETIYNHETNRALSFAFEFNKEYYDFFLKDTFSDSKEEEEKNEMLDKKNEVLNYLKGVDNAHSLLNFEVCNDLSNHQNIIFSASNANIGTVKILFPHNKNADNQDIYLIGDNPKCVIEFESKFYEQTFYIKDVEYQKHGFLTIVIGDSLKYQIKEYSGLEKNDFERLYWNIGYLLMAQNYLQMQFHKIEYINPLLHKIAERVYVQNDRKKTREVKNIKDLIDFLDTTTSQKTLEMKLKLTNLLKEFGLAESFLLKKEGFTREFRVKVNDLENNIKDVGFGVSLQLPIFAQAIISENTKAFKNNGTEVFTGETLLIEQPEVHLHPRLQAKFIETLLGIGNNNVYFIETHSEHIIRMLQVLIKNKKFNLKSDDISIHYFKKNGKKMEKSLHKIEDDGVLMPNFPKGFYDVSYNLALTLMD
jgi:predicted ATPase